MSQDQGLNNRNRDTSNQHAEQDRTRLSAGGARTGGEFKPGDVISQSYEVLRWIGAGGMGNVYCVRHTILGREYALKTLSGDKVNDVVWRRFQNEAQAIGRMSHPNIVAIYNFGVHDERLPYYVMDLLQGKSLLDLLALRGPMPVDQVVSICLEVAEGLGYAHKKGIVHRDIKPGNILILDKPEQTGRVKIVDFGIAKLSGTKDPKNQYLTNVGEIFGSPYYMSPEQSLGERIDARSDAYSLGCTMFEMLTGVPPLRGQTAMATMLLQQTTEPPTLRAASGGKEFPEMLEQVVATLLAKAPMDRYQTMELLAQDLKSIAGGNQLAINPYAGTSAQTVRGLDGNTGRQTGRQYQEESGDSEEGAQEGQDNTGKLVLLSACILVLIGLAAAGTWYFFQTQHKSEPPRPIVELNNSAKDFNETFSASSTKFSGADRILNPERRAAAVPSQESLNDTKPFSHIETKKGKETIVFDFPADYTIGDVRTPTSSDIPARGQISMEQVKRVEFAPDPCVLKYPQFLRRFRDGDLDGIKIQGAGANDELLKIGCEIPGPTFLHLENSPNLTATSLQYIDKIKNLSNLKLEGKTLSGETLSHLKCLGRLKTFSLRSEKDPASYLKMMQGSKIKMLLVQQCPMDRKCFEYIATMKQLDQLVLIDSKFSENDLRLLAEMPRLKTIRFNARQITPLLVPAVKSIKSLQKIVISDPGYGSNWGSELARQLAPIQLNLSDDARELPIQSNFLQ